MFAVFFGIGIPWHDQPDGPSGKVATILSFITILIMVLILTRRRK